MCLRFIVSAFERQIRRASLLCANDKSSTRATWRIISRVAIGGVVPLMKNKSEGNPIVPTDSDNIAVEIRNYKSVSVSIRGNKFLEAKHLSTNYGRAQSDFQRQSLFSPTIHSRRLR